MKKSNINLLINREDYRKFENLFERIKLFLAILVVILSIILFSFFILLKNKSDVYNKINSEKKSYLQLLANRKGDEARINYIEKKYSDLKKFLLDDADSVEYYEILSDAIKDSSDSAKLKSLEVDKTRETTFTISFSLFEKMMNFLKFAESEDFLKNFEKISLKNFVIFGEKNKTQNFELSFTGKFIQIKTDEQN